MSEFNIEDLDVLIARSREGSLAQLLALQLKSQIRNGEQLAAENAAARNAVQVFCDVVGANTDAICEEVGPEGVRAILAAMSATGNMSATDRILAEIKSNALPANIAEIIDSGDLESILYASEASYSEEYRMAFYNFRQLREGADK